MFQNQKIANFLNRLSLNNCWPNCQAELHDASFRNRLSLETLEARMMLSTVDVFAAGATGQENMQLLIDGVVVQTFQAVEGSIGQREFSQFTWETSETISADQISVRFTNDAFDATTGLDRNLFVDRVVVDGRIYESESSATFVTNFWGSNGLTSGNLGVEELNVNGQFNFSNSGVSTQTVTTVSIAAFGTEGGERFELLVDGEVQDVFFAAKTAQRYEADFDRKIEFDQIRVRFTNDAFDLSSGFDRNLIVFSVEIIDLETSQAESRSPMQYGVFSTGTWLAEDGVVAGFGRGNVLHTNGYFEFQNAENRSFDGARNNTSSNLFDAGRVDSPLQRKSGLLEYGGDGSGDEMISDQQRPNARDVSNVVASGSSNIANVNGLSDFTWLWGQFLDHDLSLSTTEEGAEVNGDGSIAVNDPDDPIGPADLRFTRSDFVLDEDGNRQQFNILSSFIDASNVYGSDQERADALRSFSGGRLKMTADGLLPRNGDGLFNEDGGRPNPELFFAGDARANENVALTAIHTLFVREHNRLAGVIADQNPQYSDEEIFQLARKIVGAQLQIITYNEFLPAILGQFAPADEDFAYNQDIDPSILNSFAHAAYRFGHTMLSTDLKLVATGGDSPDSISLSDAFFNPDFIRADSDRIDQLLGGAVEQQAQNIDNVLVEDVRSFLFGPRGAGGLDLAALNIQRGRDHGLPDYNALREAFGLARVTSFAQITSDVGLQQRLSDVYGGNIDNIDPWVGGLAEDHVAGAAVGELLGTIIATQFTNLRDGDRLFYRSDVAGLYRDGILREEIRNIIDLDRFSAAEVIGNNTNFRPMQSAFFAVPTEKFLAVTVSGDTGSERFQVVVDGQILGTFTTSTDVQRFTFAAPQDIEAGDSVRVVFLNDFRTEAFDRNLQVSSIQVGDVGVDPGSQSVFSTGTWRADDGVQAGLGRGNYLHANGFFEFIT